MSTQTVSKISLVGAGPGDVELITVKGLDRIKKADVILYDALVNQELLTFAPIAKKIFVGKRKGFKALEQEEINDLLISCAKEFGNVVRLKGGDSFVFGRGMEEIQRAIIEGIPTEVIPGISSSIGVPALSNIPVTHRGISPGFHVVSATLADGSLNPDIAILPLSTATSVILMGVSRIAEIALAYALHSKESVPAAIIVNGSLPTSQTVISTLSELAQYVVENEMKGPGIIVIGEVVRFGQATEFVNEIALACEII